MIKICPILPGAPVSKPNLPHFCNYLIDDSGLGCERSVLRFAQQNPGEDLFVFHSDIWPVVESWENVLDWEDEINKYKRDFPRAGIISCTLIFPDRKGTRKGIQYAGGTFLQGLPNHSLEECKRPRKSQWATWGGCLITAEALACLEEDPHYLWSYVVDCEYSLQIRRAGFDIMQVPTQMYHEESRDNKIVRAQNPIKNFAETHNLRVFREKWGGTEFIKDEDNIERNKG